MEVNFKELTFKGERPLVFILSGAGLSAESGIPTFRVDFFEINVEKISNFR